MLGRLGALRHSMAGNVAMIFALMLPVLIFMGGGVLDLGNLLQRQTQLQAAADAASLASVATSSAGYKAGAAMAGDGPITTGVAQAQGVCAANFNASNVPAGTVLNSCAATVNKVGGVISSIVTAQATYNTYFMRIFGFSSYPINVTSHASSTLPPYIDFYLLLDNTPSMGLGATTADISTMQNQLGCAFACHTTSDPANDFYDKAHAIGATLRIDRVTSATQSLMTTAQQSEGSAPLYRMAIYDFGVNANSLNIQDPKVFKVYPAVGAASPVTSNLSDLSTAASGISLMTISDRSYAEKQTDFGSSLTAMYNELPSPGSGANASSPQEVVFMVTDGMNDSYNCNYHTTNDSCRRIASFDPSVCTSIKNKGVQIALLYTKFWPPTGDSWSMSTANVPTYNLTPQLQACASPGLYFEVDTDQDIGAAMATLFQKVVSVVRITS